MPDEVLRRVLGLSDELQRFNAVIHRVLHSDHPKADVIGPLLWAAAQTCDSVNKLAFYGKLRDCFSLGRCAWETLLNAAYVNISGDEIADKARKHALQKSYRDLDRSLEVGNTRIDVKSNLTLDPTAIPGLQEALESYTTKNGGEVRDWIGVNIDSRLAAIAAATSEGAVTGLSFARIAIYRHASDIVHGTLFGARFALGSSPFQKPVSDLDGFVGHHAQSLIMVLLLLQYSVHDVIGLLAESFDLQPIAVASTDALREIDSNNLFPKK